MQQECYTMSQNEQTHFKSLAANAARMLKCVWPFWDIVHWSVKGILWELLTSRTNYPADIFLLKVNNRNTKKGVNYVQS